MQRPTSQPSELKSSAPGIIDTIGTAFSLLNQRPYLIWPLVLVDLYLWLGVRLSAAPLVRWLERQFQSGSAESDQVLSLLNDLRDANLFVLLAVMMPSLLRQLGRGAVAGSALAGSVGNFSWWVLATVSFTLSVIGTFIGAFYLTVVGYLVRGQPVRGELVGEAARNAVRILGFLVVAVGVFFLVAMPMLFFATIGMALGVNAMAIASPLLTVGLLWYLLMLFFAVHAIVVSGAGPFRAMYLSYNVVRANFWKTIGFVAVFLIFRQGLPLALHLFTRSPWSVPFALIANAYLATGITAAAMLYYRDRARHLVPSLPAPPFAQPHTH